MQQLGTWTGNGTLPSFAISPAGTCVAFLHPARPDAAPHIEITTATVQQHIPSEPPDSVAHSLPVALLTLRSVLHYMQARKQSAVSC